MQNRRLYRSTEDKVVAGVAGGLANYFDIDPVIARIVFVALALFGGGGVLIYIVLWVVLPEDRIQKTTYHSRYDAGAESSAEEQTETPEYMNTEKQSSEDGNFDPAKSKGSIIAGVVLITLGSLFLIDNFVPRINFGDLWPVLLVILGIVILTTSLSGGDQDNKRKRH